MIASSYLRDSVIMNNNDIMQNTIEADKNESDNEQTTQCVKLDIREDGPIIININLDSEDDKPAPPKKIEYKKPTKANIKRRWGKKEDRQLIPKIKDL
jgi:hypothetical protein